jgi:hypothetical protein
MQTRNLYEVPTGLGVTLLVATLNPYLRSSLYDKAVSQFPDPDPKPFEKPLPDAAVEVIIPATENIEYVKLLRVAKLRQLARFYEYVIDAGAVVDTAEGKANTLAEFSRELAQARSMLDLAGERDDFQDLVKYVLLQSGEEIRTVANCATDSLTSREVMLGIQSFQYYCERSPAGENTYRKTAPGTD